MIATIPIGIVLLIGHSMRKNKEGEDFNIKYKSVSYRFFHKLAIVVLLAMILAIFYYMSPLSL
jgi:tetrahydromethanopterin S-methyltransferase subunit B